MKKKYLYNQPHIVGLMLVVAGNITRREYAKKYFLLDVYFKIQLFCFDVYLILYHDYNKLIRI